jgi:hypothetical protein
MFFSACPRRTTKRDLCAELKLYQGTGKNLLLVNTGIFDPMRDPRGKSIN